MKNKSDIDQFVSYFSEEIEKIDSLKERLYKKILFSCMLDTLGQARFPDGNNWKRIVSFIQNCSNWKDKSRVSLFHLELCLSNALKPEMRLKSELYKYVQKNLQDKKNILKNVDRLSIEIDPFYNEIIKKAANEDEKKIVKLNRHVELFYAYRNILVHNFKEPGYPMEYKNDDTIPYYHGYLNDDTYPLVYPISFFMMLCNKCLDGLKEYLIKCDINPYENYNFDEMWIEKRKLISKKKNIFNILFRIKKLFFGWFLKNK